MKITLILLLVGIIYSCSRNENNDQYNSNSDAIIIDNHFESDSTPQSKLSLVESVKNKHYSIWKNIEKNNQSLQLHFNLGPNSKGLLKTMYTSECWIEFPIVVKENKILVLWDKIVDSKYNFELVKNTKSVDDSIIGKPFFELTQINDTTLQAEYLMTDIRNTINLSDSSRLLLPQFFYLTNGKHSNSYH